MKTVAETYKTGDCHPIHKHLAFVEYDNQGREWWTSIATDPGAPFRLCSASKPNRDCDTRAEKSNEGEGK